MNSLAQTRTIADHVWTGTLTHWHARRQHSLRWFSWRCVLGNSGYAYFTIIIDSIRTRTDQPRDVFCSSIFLCWFWRKKQQQPQKLYTEHSRAHTWTVVWQRQKRYNCCWCWWFGWLVYLTGTAAARWRQSAYRDNNNKINLIWLRFSCSRTVFFLIFKKCNEKKTINN